MPSLCCFKGDYSASEYGGKLQSFKLYVAVSELDVRKRLNETLFERELRGNLNIKQCGVLPEMSQICFLFTS